MSDINVVLSEGVKGRIFCKNYKCSFNCPLPQPVNFKFSQIHTPFEGDVCKGECESQTYAFIDFEEEIKDFKYEGSECFLSNIEEPPKSSACIRIDCVHNEFKLCTRGEILVDRLNDLWVCKCFSFRKIRGHTDWSALLQGGKAKGGQIDDAYAEKINKHAKTTRSYRTHMKQIS